MEISNPYISVELETSGLEDLIKSIQKDLDLLDIKYTEKLTRKPHISIAYVLGVHKEDEIKQVCTEITEDKFHTKITGFDVIDTEYYKKEGIQHLLTLALEHSHDFNYATELVSESFKVKEFDGGFKAHISLIGIKTTLSEEAKELLSRTLEVFQNELVPKVKINGDRISVFNDKREEKINIKF